MQDEIQEPSADFKPNLVNSVCFLVQFIIQLITFAVNYQGPPFNASIKDTTVLRVTFFWGSIGFAVLALDLIPSLTQSVSLVGHHSVLLGLICPAPSGARSSICYAAYACSMSLICHLYVAGHASWELLPALHLVSE